MGWTDERVALLTRLWNEGFSASQIATQLGGVTRNAVIGKVHRLKLEGRVKIPAAAPETASSHAGETVAVEAVAEMEMPARVLSMPSAVRPMARPVGGTLGGTQGAAALKLDPGVDLEIVFAAPEPQRVMGEVVPISRNLTLVQLSDRTCKWPLGDPLLPDFRFCGNHSNDVSPYCAYHARLAFQPVSERRRVR